MSILGAIVLYFYGYKKIGFEWIEMAELKENERLKVLRYLFPLTYYNQVVDTLFQWGLMGGIYRLKAKIKIEGNLSMGECISMLLMFYVFMVSTAIEAAMIISYNHWHMVYALIAFGVGSMVGVRLVEEELRHIQKIRQRQIGHSLPVFLTRMILMVSAGLSLQRAWAQCVETEGDNYFYRCGQSATEDMRLNGSMRLALERMSQRMSDYRVDQLVKLIVQMGDYGDATFSLRLESLKTELWQERLRLAREMAEEAKVKLLVPLFITFGGILLIIMVPIIIAMKGVFI